MSIRVYKVGESFKFEIILYIIKLNYILIIFDFGMMRIQDYLADQQTKIQEFIDSTLITRSKLIEKFDYYGGLHPSIILSIIFHRFSLGETPDTLNDPIVFEQICNDLEIKVENIGFEYENYINNLELEFISNLKKDAKKIYKKLDLLDQINIYEIGSQVIKQLEYYGGDYYIYLHYLGSENKTFEDLFQMRLYEKIYVADPNN